MANSQTDSNQIDRLSSLPVALLVTILSFLPTHIAARTSVLCRCFRHLWEATPSLAFISLNFPPRSNHSRSDANFVAMAKHVLLRRDPSHPIIRLHIDVNHCSHNTRQSVLSLLPKVVLLNLRHLTLRGFWLSHIVPILPIIFTINPLRYLELDFYDSDVLQFNFPSKFNLTCLRSLSIILPKVDLAGLNQFISKLSSLEDLHLRISGMLGLSLSSQTIRKLDLDIVGTDCTRKQLDIVGLSLPSLELLDLQIDDTFGSLSHIHANLPLLRKAEIYLGCIRDRNVSIVAGFLNCIAHVEELKLELFGHKKNDYPVTILWESGKDVPIFPNLKHLDVTLWFHKQNFEAVTRMLHNCPVLKSLNLHQDEFQDHPNPILLESGKDVPIFSNLKHLDVTLWFHKQNFEAVTRMLPNCPVLKSLNLRHHETPWPIGLNRRDWQSQLPCNPDGNCDEACFRNLHLEEEQKKFMELLSKKYSFKRQARN